MVVVLPVGFSSSDQPQGGLMRFKTCEYIKAALAKVPADLVVRNPKIVNVNTGELYQSDIIVKRERIVSVGDSSESIGHDTFVIDGAEMYAVPGFIDAHVHVESSMLTITEFSKIISQHGTTAILWDPHEIVNVAGISALKIVIREAVGLPIHVFFVVPSCVPSAPGRETSGASLTPIDISNALKLQSVIGLGEMMNYPGVLSCSSQVMRKLELARRTHSIIDGHAPGLHGKELCGYIASGIRSDHESVKEDEGLEKLRLGMWLMIRESSTSKDLANLIKPIVRGSVDDKHCMFVSDDISVNDLLLEGHMDHILRKAISRGMDPLTAVKLATINPATYMRVDEEIGSISPGCFADFLLVKDLQRLDIQKIISMGREISLSRFPETYRYPRALTNTLVFRRELEPSDFMLKCKDDRDKADFRVIKLMEGTLHTLSEIRVLKIQHGNVIASRDVSYAAVIERHHRTGNIGRGLVAGLGRFVGAIAQTIAHDSHNLIVAGSNPYDMALAAQVVANMQGGVALAHSGKLLASVKLDVAGLISTEAASAVARKKALVEDEARKLGLIAAKSPITSLSFISLAVIPELRLTDKGLFDVVKGTFVDVIVEKAQSVTTRRTGTTVVE
jgi:adenine deaminase